MDSQTPFHSDAIAQTQLRGHRVFTCKSTSGNVNLRTEKVNPYYTTKVFVTDEFGASRFWNPIVEHDNNTLTSAIDEHNAIVKKIIKTGEPYQTS